MSGIDSKSFAKADEVRTPDKTRVDVVHVGGTEVAQFTFEPGWSWESCIKPVAGTESCQNEHVGFIRQGRLHVAHQDGTELTVEPGDAYHIAPGHNAWVEGDEAVIAYEFKSASTYAKA